MKKIIIGMLWCLPSMVFGMQLVTDTKGEEVGDSNYFKRENRVVPIGGYTEIDGERYLDNINCGGNLVLEKKDTLVIMPNSSLTLCNIMLHGVHTGNLVFKDVTSKLILKNSGLVLDADYAPSWGSIEIRGDCWLEGRHLWFGLLPCFYACNKGFLLKIMEAGALHDDDTVKVIYGEAPRSCCLGLINKLPFPGAYTMDDENLSILQ